MSPKTARGFSGPLRVEQLDAKNWQLLNDLEYRMCGPGVDLSISVPRETRTDFASVPRLLWPVFPPNGIYARAAVLHDHLYRTGSIPRFLSDALFRQASADCGASMFTRWFMWAAVRLFGGRSYRAGR